jgi:hypothetical protein
MAIAIVIAALIAIQAHRDHLSFKVQTQADITALETKVGNLQVQVAAGPLSATISPKPIDSSAVTSGSKPA